MGSSGFAKNSRIVSGIIFRYILAEALFSFFVCFLFFFFIFSVNQLLLMAQTILTKKVPFFQVAQLIFYSLPSIISLSAPFASLVATLMTIGRLSSDNEILVMLSSGISYLNIFLPALIMGILISLISFFTNDVLLPLGTVQYTRLWRRILASTPALELEANSVKRFRGTVIITGEVTGRSFDSLVIMDRTNDGERRIIMAQDAEFRDAGDDGIVLELSEAFIHSSKEIVRNDYDYASASFLQYWIAQSDLIQAVSAITPREMSSTDVRRQIGIKTVERLDALDRLYHGGLVQALNLEDSLRRGPGSDSWNRRDYYFSSYTKEYQAVQVRRKDMSLLSHQLEYFKKFSLPTGAFFFVFLAVPLGLLAKKSGQTVGFIFGLVIAFLYWAFLTGGQMMGSRLGYSPFWTMWLPNILAGSVGLIMCVVRIRK
jgi:lipopolysaccharide export system permease protein